MNISHMYRAPLDARARGNAVSSQCNRVLIYEPLNVRANVKGGNCSQELAVKSKDECSFGVTKLDGIFGYSVKNGLKVKGRVTDCL